MSGRRAIAPVKASKYWCFTLNNPTEQEKRELNLLGNPTAMLGRHINYLICQEEAGEEGTHHLQGYVEFDRPTKIRSVKNRIGSNRIHAEGRRGTQKQAIDYCKKSNTRVEGGLSIEVGEPIKLQKQEFKRAIEKLKDGGELDEIFDEFPSIYAMHKEKLIDYKLDTMGKRDWPTEIHIFVGKTGTGKSSTANKLYPNAYRCPWPTGGRWWWPNYQGQETVIMDEFRHQIKMDVMLTLFDRYSMKLERKGGNMEFLSKRIIVTTNIDPKDWYPNVSKEDKEPLRRRLTENCWIWDFHEAEYPNFHRTLRIEPFQFNETNQQDVQANFNRNRGLIHNGNDNWLQM